MTSQILALVPDLFLACLEAALDIITGFGWIITAARLTYMLTKYAIRKWREWRDARPQKLCAKAPQLDCCVNSVMAWYDRQALAQRQTEAEFRADSQDLLARALKYPNSCTPWSVTLFAEPPDDETLKVLLAREMEQGGPGIFTRKIRTHLSLFGVTSGWTSFKRDARLVVARSTFMIEWPRKEGEKHAETRRFSTSCEDFIPIGGKDSRDTKGLRAKLAKGVPLGIRF
ncbi:GIP, partial [Symbiodinium necroappetens]